MVDVAEFPSSPEQGPIALILPGAGYTTQAPLLYWCAAALAEAGWRVFAVEWTVDDGVRTDPVSFVSNAVDHALALLPEPPRFVVAKSLGTLALPRFVADIPGAWITPLLSAPGIAEALNGASTTQLVVGGRGDPTWKPELIQGTRGHIVQLDAADHSLRSAAGWRTDAARQLDVVGFIAEHAARSR